jgi:hypothetical protein
MKKLALFLLLAFPLAAQTPQAAVTLLNAVTTTGASTGWANNGGSLWVYVVLHVTGAPTGCTFTVQTSTALASGYGTATAATDTGFAVNPFTCTGTNTDAVVGVYLPSDSVVGRYVRVNLSALSGGTTPTVTAKLYAFAAQKTLAQIAGTVTVSGTVTANQGTAGATAWPVSESPRTYASANAATASTVGASYVASQVAKASAANFFGITVYNSKSTAQFYMCFNATSLPANGATSITVPLSCAGTSTCSLNVGSVPINFSTGLTCGNSTTSPTLTTGAADSLFQVIYQ